MIHYRIEAKTDLQEKRIKPKELTDVLYLADKQSTAIAVLIYDNGVEFDLTGYSVVCWWMYPSTGETLVFSGEVRGTNQAVCVPPDEMYSVTGRGLLTIKVVQGGDVDCTVFSAWVDVVRSTTDEQTATGTAIANYDALLPLAERADEIIEAAQAIESMATVTETSNGLMIARDKKKLNKIGAFESAAIGNSSVSQPYNVTFHRIGVAQFEIIINALLTVDVADNDDEAIGIIPTGKGLPIGNDGAMHYFPATATTISGGVERAIPGVMIGIASEQHWEEVTNRAVYVCNRSGQTIPTGAMIYAWPTYMNILQFNAEMG